MSTLYIMQGPPGSGKSTIAKILSESYGNGFFRICSTDHYFEDPSGDYVFIREDLAKNHKLNQEAVVAALDFGFNVIVDNTNIKKEHARPYVEMAKARGIPIVIIRVCGNFKNIHGVPQDVVDRMHNQMEDLTELL